MGRFLSEGLVEGRPRIWVEKNGAVIRRELGESMVEACEQCRIVDLILLPKVETRLVMRSPKSLIGTSIPNHGSTISHLALNITF